MDSSMALGVFRNLTTVNSAATVSDMDMEDMDTMFKSSTIQTIMDTDTTTATSTTTTAPEPSVSMNNFYPALVQCFGIIICGISMPKA
ncbi:unnamed protein product [Ceratitis capitata]|uniref:(Mediterranean fruit fly) hypothetical protein n=1 Tax=Ceratitis capitata TaxID=7213 RepID=A0A811UUL7_CERCA|nr:unnamed protein product [Ceratitis capitata]